MYHDKPREYVPGPEIEAVGVAGLTMNVVRPSEPTPPRLTVATASPNPGKTIVSITAGNAAAGDLIQDTLRVQL